MVSLLILTVAEAAEVHVDVRCVERLVGKRRIDVQDVDWQRMIFESRLDRIVEIRWSEHVALPNLHLRATEQPIDIFMRRPDLIPAHVGIITNDSLHLQMLQVSKDRQAPLVDTPSSCQRLFAGRKSG